MLCSLVLTRATWRHILEDDIHQYCDKLLVDPATS
jgi:hypothetical protein